MTSGVISTARASKTPSIESNESLAGSSNDQLGVMLLLANEGLRFLVMLNLLPMDSAERERIWQRMLSMAEAGKP